MATPPPLPNRPTGRISLGWIIFLLAIPILVVGSIVFLRARVHYKTEEKLAAVRNQNLPTSGRELNEWLPAIEPSRNGALLIADSFGDLYLFPDERSNVVDTIRILSTNHWSADLRSLVRAHIASNAPALSRIDAALELDDFRYPIDYSPGFATLLPHLGSLKRVSTLMSLRAAIAAEDHLTNDWPRLLEQQIKLAETLNNEPVVIGTLVRFACSQMSVRVLERALQQPPPAASALRPLQAAFLRAADTNLLPRSLVTERSMVIPTFSMSFEQLQRIVNDDEPPSEKQIRGGMFLRMTGIFERDLGFYLTTMDTAIKLAQLPAPENLVLANHFESAHAEARAGYYIISSMILPALSKFANKQATTQAQLRMCATALAIEAFRQANGKLPSSLLNSSPPSSMPSRWTHSPANPSATSSLIPATVSTVSVPTAQMTKVNPLLKSERYPAGPSLHTIFRLPFLADPISSPFRGCQDLGCPQVRRESMLCHPATV